MCDFNLLHFARGFFILLHMCKEKKLELISCFGLLIVTIIWGFAFVVVKSSLDYIPPTYMLAFRFTVAGVVLGVIFIKKLIRVTKDELLHGALIGASLFLAEMFQTYGCKLTTAGKNAFLTTIYVILVPFLHWIFNKVKPELKCIVAAIIGFWGIGLISLNEKLTVAIGDTLTLICGFFYALQIVLIARYASKDDVISLSIWQLIFSAVFSWIAAPIFEGKITADMFCRESVLGILYLGLLSTMVCFLLQTVCQKYAPPGPAAIIMGMESVFGAVAAFIFLGEIMTGKMIVGCAMMIVAMIMVEVEILPKFFPDERCESAYLIDYKKLYDDGIRGIIFDIDNTLVEHGFPPDDRSIKLLKELVGMGFKVLFLSNNKEMRVKTFRDGSIEEGMYLYKAGKPKKSGFTKAMEMMGTDENSTILIGDQIFTDIWGAKNSNIRNILVNPIDKKEEIQIVLKRRLEWLVLASYEKREKNKKNS